MDIQGRQTLEEETFYTDPGVSQFPLAGGSIFAAEVFVDELRRLSRSQMRSLLEKHPEDVTGGIRLYE